MIDDRRKRLYTPNEKIKKMMEELGPELIQYFDDIGKTKKLKRQSSKSSSFSIGDMVSINNDYGTIIYGPYKSEKNIDRYEVEMESGEIISIDDDGNKIVKYNAEDSVVSDEDTDDIF
jgi:hypothetical protein